jgi:hypothetical protein
VFPTGGDNDFTGNGKWLTGPSWVYINQRIPKLQFGTLGWHHFTIGETSSGNNKKNVTETSVQPFITKHWGKGWYVGMQDVPWTYNYKSENWTLPMGPKVGRVFKFGAQPINLFGAVYYDPKTDGANAKWTAKINVTLLYPE